jgi:hypothetical protein
MFLYLYLPLLFFKNKQITQKNKKKQKKNTVVGDPMLIIFKYATRPKHNVIEHYWLQWPKQHPDGAIT